MKQKFYHINWERPFKYDTKPKSIMEKTDKFDNINILNIWIKKLKKQKDE